MAAPVLRIGQVEVTALLDSSASAPCSMLFPSVAKEQWAPHAEHLGGGTHIELSITSYLLRAGGKTILVDTGIGAKDRQYFPNGRLPDALAEIGVRPEQVDLVLATHIHVDHVGWHTTAKGDAYVPTFPKARHVFSRREWEHWTAPAIADAPGNQYVVDSVLPLQGAADVDLVDGEHQVTDELTLLPTPGHTPAHTSVLISSAGERCVILGDVAHNAAQLTETSWSGIFDTDPALAAQSREMLAARIEEERLLVAAGHFRFPGFGRLVRIDGKRYWRGL